MNHLDNNIYQYIAAIEEQISLTAGLEIVTDYTTPLEKYTLVSDAVLLRNKSVLALFEFKIYQDQIKEQDFLDSRIPSNIPFKYYILTNGLQSYVLNTFNGKVEQFHSVSDLVNYVIKIPSYQEISERKTAISKAIIGSIATFYDKHNIINGKSYQKYTRIRQYLSYETIADNLNFDQDGQFFTLTNDIRDLNNFENGLFNLILDDLRPYTKVYRYTTLDTVFATLNNLSLRMNGIAGMNDISEVEYVDHYLDNTFNIYSNPKELKTLNKRFISCCSTLSDNLNQWRLYGDDCKGACLVFKVSGGFKLPGLQLKQISYGSKINGLNFHLELELIKFILDEVKVKTGQLLKFRTLEIWKHFFKPYEYKEEKEVRLLLILSASSSIKGEGQDTPVHNLKKEWNLTASHKILAPYVTVPLFDKILPIQLEKVVLGSKCSERVLNQQQFQLFLTEKGLNNIKIEISSINNYR